MTSLQAGAFVNMDAIQRSIQCFTDTIKTMKKHMHVDRNWDVIINLLDEQFILPIQTLSAPHTSTSLCPVVDKPSSSYCSISRKLRIHCERCMFTQTIETKGNFDFKAASQAKVSNYEKQLERSKMPKGTATYWKHDENQDDGDDVTFMSS